MNEQMITKLAKEFYNTYFIDLHEVNHSDNTLYSASELTEMVDEYVRKYNLKKEEELRLKQEIISMAKEAYIKTFGEEEMTYLDKEASIKEEYETLLSYRDSMMNQYANRG